MAKRKVLHVITNFGGIGGAETMLIRVINQSDQEFEHVIVSLMDVSEVLTSRLNTNIKHYALGASSIVGLLKATFQLRKISKVEKPERVYAWMYHANFVTALAKCFGFIKVDLVWGVRHSLDCWESEKTSTKLAILFGKALRWAPAKVVHCSERALKQHVEFGYHSDEKSLWIPNGYTFPEHQLRSFSHNNFVIGAAGRFHDAKDYQTLLSAFSMLLNANSAFTLVIAGRDIDSDNQVLAEMIEQSNIPSKKIRLLGQQLDMNSFYQSVDFFVLSSKTEGFPNVLAEAIGAGCIAFSTDVGDANKILNDTQRIVPIGDSKALANSIEFFSYKTKDELLNISNEDANRVRKQFSIQAAADKLLQLS
ncbi:glycosyltransferase [Agarivorans sp. Alg241-V36]|uniref:glycosyltransferase n=1 Tax=Agarivorans sp. Alg241-V36 TaxID=2305992 RepID=UPI0013D22A31|nr:glycosyltransferase [Agarivorans sp. Alg241-V36]